MNPGREERVLLSPSLHWWQSYGQNEMEDSGDSTCLGIMLDILHGEGNNERCLFPWTPDDFEYCPCCQRELFVTDEGRCAICGRIIVREP